MIPIKIIKRAYKEMECAFQTKDVDAFKKTYDFVLNVYKTQTEKYKLQIKTSIDQGDFQTANKSADDLYTLYFEQYKSLIRMRGIRPRLKNEQAIKVVSGNLEGLLEISLEIQKQLLN